MEQGPRAGDDESDPKPMEISSSSEVDVISSSIQEGTRGVGLVAVVAVCTCMASISVLLILQYQPSPDSAIASDDDDATGDDHQQQCNAIVAASRFFPSTTTEAATSHYYFPLWADLIAEQIQIIQNLVHASLLGGAGFVAAYRGDAVWLYFARNCCFYFGLAALSYFTLDLWRGSGSSSITTLFGSTSFIVSALLSTFCIVAFVRLEFVRYQVNLLVGRYTRGHEANYPKYLPSTRSQLVKTRAISRLADCLQGAAIIFTMLTTLFAILDENCKSETQVGLLEMSYRLGAHEAFLLSLLFLVTTFPGDQACVGGTVICAGWRLTLALTYLVPLAMSEAAFSLREMLSLVNTSLESIFMLPILVLSLLLLRENSESTIWRTTKNSSSGAVKYSRIEEDEDQDDDDDDNDDRSDAPNEHVRQIKSLSMLQISKSSIYSSRQRRGAFIVWISSACLLFEMTVECLMLLQFSVIIGGFAAEVYQWGMHICAMYLFCTHMSVNSPEVYCRARWLMAVACPGGTVIAVWQLWVLISYTTTTTTTTTTTPHDFDTPTRFAILMFLVRAICGIGQCIGLALLQTTEPESETVESDSTEASVELESRLKQAWFVLFKLFIPTLFMKIVADAYFSSCGEPLISPTTPGCVQDFYLLAKSWPGLGTFFHFGVLLVIFASDALLGAAYPPSLAIATLFSAHVTILLAGDLIINTFLLDGSTTALHEIILKVMWMLSVGCLWLSLHRLWKWRVVVV